MAKKIKKVIKHLKEDIKTFNKEAAEDKELIKDLKIKKNKNKDAEAVNKMIEAKKKKKKKK
jgi:hypothetical protein